MAAAAVTVVAKGLAFDTKQLDLHGRAADDS